MSYITGCACSMANMQAGYSPLEQIAGSYSRSFADNDVSYMAAEASQRSFVPFYEHAEEKRKLYPSNNYAANLSSGKNVTAVGALYSGVDDFLDPQRPRSAFIGEASEIKEFAEQAFFSLTGKEFPDDVAIRLLSGDEMNRRHSENVLGFAVNRKHQGLLSEIFVKKDMLDRMMITIGHELGHVLTRRLDDEKDEEAKAFAFSIAWMKKIKKENIAGLAASIKIDAPARNGLHDTALDFVLKLVSAGREAVEVYKDIVNRFITVRSEVLWQL